MRAAACRACLHHRQCRAPGRASLSAPVTLDTSNGREWWERAKNDLTVRYDISYDPRKQRWYLDAPWSYKNLNILPPSVDDLSFERMLAVDVTTSTWPAGWPMVTATQSGLRSLSSPTLRA